MRGNSLMSVMPKKNYLEIMSALSYPKVRDHTELLRDAREIHGDSPITAMTLARKAVKFFDTRQLFRDDDVTIGEEAMAGFQK
jgi:hypothetical protein